MHIKTNKTENQLHSSCKHIPNIVPAAGGCSVSVITIMKIDSTTNTAINISRNIVDPSYKPFNPVNVRINTNRPPKIIAIECPPITLLGLEAIDFGITNIVKADDATAITIGALRTTSPNNNNKMKIGMQIPI